MVGLVRSGMGSRGIHQTAAPSSAKDAVTVSIGVFRFLVCVHRPRIYVSTLGGSLPCDEDSMSVGFGSCALL